MPFKLLKVDQAAELLNIRPSTLRSWLLKRRISSHRIGRSVRISSEEIEKLLRESQVPAKEPTKGDNVNASSKVNKRAGRNTDE